MRILRQMMYGLSILAIAVSSQSALAANDWQINSAGSGAGGATAVSALDVNGVGFVQVQPDDNAPGLFSFIEHGAYRALNTDGSTQFGAHEITVSYSVSGSGNFLDQSALRMSAGRIDLYSDANLDFGTGATHYGADNGTRFASFEIVDGYLANDQGLFIVNARGIAGSFAEGYLFNAAGTDMATLSNVQLELALFNQPSIPDGPIISGIVCGLAQACSSGPVSLSPLAYTVQDRGSVTISAVPEPESSAMLLAGLGVVAAVARRRRSQQGPEHI
ncbi:flocculation-associated PEP-CTERM protein PepA [Ferribacterium limneticum]|uniref:flocculation-associated PEP-CTERM protein PepA n=1 Tax=Ferribacterium limneticum TaxID=76259 RepID=UPI001CFA76F4|nr:flocculation-associated PEP-CTERM protein PepA [Ferribacterium limneticum]UCV18890.1 flocculation-associated PEP-CTERM protein PepA [Ferribacterium limneticum]